MIKPFSPKLTESNAPLPMVCFPRLKSVRFVVTANLRLQPWIYRLAFSNPALGPFLVFNASCSYANIQTNVTNMHAAGISIAVGTDAIGRFAGAINYPFGRSLHCELQNLVDAGFGNAETIQAATAGAAKLYRLYDRGSIATGMRADLLLLNSNAVEDITNTLDINAAWVGGLQITAISAQKGQSCDPASLSL